MNELIQCGKFVANILEDYDINSFQTFFQVFQFFCYICQLVFNFQHRQAPSTSLLFKFYRFF